MTTRAQTPAKPTSGQLAYIRELNNRTGTEFTSAANIGVRQQIKRLRALAERQDLTIERFTQLCEDAGLPLFDEVRREGTAVRFVCNDRKVMVVVDLDLEPTDDDPASAA